MADSKEAKTLFFNRLDAEMIIDGVSDESRNAFLHTCEMIIGEEILNPDSVYSDKNFFDLRKRGEMALPWHKSDSRQKYLCDIMECIIVRHREIHHGESYKDRISELQKGLTPEDIEFVEVVALGFWNA